MLIRSKFGELPGDWPRDVKIRMLESKEPFFIWPWQYATTNCINTFRNEHYKRSNRRFRRQNNVQRAYSDGYENI